MSNRFNTDGSDTLRPLRPILPSHGKPKLLPPVRSAEEQKRRTPAPHRLQSAEEIDRFVLQGIDSVVTNDTQSVEALLQTLTEELDDDLEGILDELLSIIKEGGKVPEKYALFVPYEEHPISRLHIELALREVTKTIAAGNMKESLKMYISLCQSKNVPYRRVDYSLIKDKSAAPELDPDSSYSTDAFSDIHQDLCSHYLGLVHTRDREAIFSAALLLPCHVVWNQYIFERHQAFDKICPDFQKLNVVGDFVEQIASFVKDDLDMIKDFSLALQSDGYFTDRQTVPILIAELYVSYIEKRLLRSYQMIINSNPQNSKSSKEINTKEILSTTIAVHKIGLRFYQKLKESCIPLGIVEHIEKINFRTIFSSHMERITKSFVGELTKTVETSLSTEAGLHNQKGEYVVEEGSSPPIAKSCSSIIETYEEICYLLSVEGLEDIHAMMTSALSSSIKVICKRLQTSCAVVPDREPIRFLYISYNTACKYNAFMTALKDSIHPLYGSRSAVILSRTLAGLDEALFTLEAVEHELLTRMLDIHRDNIRSCVLSSLAEATFEEQKEYFGSTRCSYALYFWNYYLKVARHDLEQYLTPTVEYLTLASLLYESSLSIFTFYNNIVPSRARMNHFKADIAFAICVIQSFLSLLGSFKPSESMLEAPLLPRNAILNTQLTMMNLLGILAAHSANIPALCDSIKQAHQAEEIPTAIYARVVSDSNLSFFASRTEPQSSSSFNPVRAMKELSGQVVEHKTLLAPPVDWDQALRRCPLPKDLLMKAAAKRHELRDDYPPLTEEQQAHAKQLTEVLQQFQAKSEDASKPSA